RNRLQEPMVERLPTRSVRQRPCGAGAAPSAEAASGGRSSACDFESTAARERRAFSAWPASKDAGAQGSPSTRVRPKGRGEARSWIGQGLSLAVVIVSANRSTPLSYIADAWCVKLPGANS